MWMSFGAELKVQDSTPGCVNTAFKAFHLSSAAFTLEVLYQRIKP